MVVAQSVVVTDGQQVQAIELAGEEETGQDQAHRSAKGVGHHAAQAILDEGGGDAQHGFGAEPGSKDGGRHHRQRQHSPGYGKVAGVFDAGCGQ